MILWPWLDAALRKISGWEEISTYIGIAAVFALVGLTAWEALVPH
jgi:hypothetical protein